MRLIETGAGQHLGKGLHAYFVTLTAPGRDDHRRWYQGKRPPSRPECHCHRHGQSDGRWNASESACWNRLRTTLARDLGGVIFAGAVETQNRGLLHRHVVMFTSRGMAYGDVQEAALRAGYGCVVDVERLESVEKAGRYLSKYVTKSSAERASVPWTVEHVDEDTGEISERSKRATYRLWSSSRSWGTTMRELKSVAAAQARARARYLEDLAQLLDAGGSDGSAPADRPSSDPP